MGSDSLHKKQRGVLIERKEEIRRTAPNKYLIVCEGEKTETNYFKGIQRAINANYKNSLHVTNMIYLDIDGTGRNTNDLVRFVSKTINRSNLEYGNVWVIFDKDSFSDNQFNSAIDQATKNGFKSGWSNESFELWFLLHFEYISTNIGRDAYCQKLTKHFIDNDIFKKSKLKLKKYDKNILEIFDILCLFGSVDDAIKRSKKLMVEHECKPPAKQAPANTVYLLVEELLKYI